MNPIREALTRLHGHWHKGSSTDGNGNYCGIGWVDKVYQETGRQFVPFHLIDIMNAVAAEQYPDRIEGEMDYFPNFNDHPKTTEEEVIAVMEKAAIRLDEQL